MGATREQEVTKESIGEKKTRYLTHTENLMMVVIDFDDGPTREPDPPHSHPHEQVTYVADGELIFILMESHINCKKGIWSQYPKTFHIPYSY